MDLSHGNLFNLHLLSNSSSANVVFYTNQDFLFHIDTTLMIAVLSNRKKPRFRLLEKIEAICGDIQISKIFSNEPGFWRREPRPVTYATAISLLWSPVVSQQFQRTAIFQKTAGKLSLSATGLFLKTIYYLPLRVVSYNTSLSVRHLVN